MYLLKVGVQKPNFSSYKWNLLFWVRHCFAYLTDLTDVFLLTFFQGVVDEWASSLFKVKFAHPISNFHKGFVINSELRFDLRLWNMTIVTLLTPCYCQWQEMDYQAEARNGLRFRWESDVLLTSASSCSYEWIGITSLVNCWELTLLLHSS